MKVAILDDYQNVALELADWSSVARRAEITVFNDHVADPSVLVRWASRRYRSSSLSSALLPYRSRLKELAGFILVHLAGKQAGLSVCSGASLQSSPGNELGPVAAESCSRRPRAARRRG
jgi:hypothetical protein